MRIPHLRRLLTALGVGALLALAPVPASAQLFTGSLTAATSTCAVDAAGSQTCVIANGFPNGVTVQITDTASGTWTVTFEVSLDGTAWVPISMFPKNSTTGATTATGAGTWSGAAGARFRVRPSAYTSGVIRISLFPTDVPMTSGGGGGGGAGADVSATGSAVPSSASFEGISVAGTLRGVTGIAAGSHFATAIAIVDSSGNQISSFGGAGGTGQNDNTAFTVGTTAATTVMGLFDNTSPTSATEDRVAALRMSANRNQYIQIRDGAGNERGLNVDASGQIAVTLAAAQTLATVSTVTAVTTVSTVTSLSQFAGNAISTNAGVVGAGVLRVTEATDSQLSAGVGATGDAAATAGGTGSLSAKFRLMTGAFGVTPADNFANPTAASITYALMGCWDGATWDRCVTTADPCSSGTKVYQNINQTAGTQLFTGTASNRTYVCSFNLVTATAQNIALVGGTGTVCATGITGIAGGSTAATGWNFAANGGIALVGGNASIFKSQANADNICLLQSAGGQVTGSMTYVVAP